MQKNIFQVIEEDVHSKTCKSTHTNKFHKAYAFFTSRRTTRLCLQLLGFRVDERVVHDGLRRPSLSHFSLFSPFPYQLYQQIRRILLISLATGWMHISNYLNISLTCLYFNLFIIFFNSTYKLSIKNSMYLTKI